MHGCVEVTFRLAGKLHPYDPAGFTLKPGDWVVVERDKDEGLGRVLRVLEHTASDASQPLRKVLRRATLEDHNRRDRLRSQEQEAYEVCQELITARKLQMRLVRSEFSFDGRRMTFYFTAAGRIDFRALVRDLASRFRRRIEMRQIGVRDETKLLGGIGPCGRLLCCCTFIRDFEPVSIRMAKKQALSLNPSKISGLCGKLMCCLAYEAALYDSPHRPRACCAPTPSESASDGSSPSETAACPPKRREHGRPPSSNRHRRGKGPKKPMGDSPVSGGQVPGSGSKPQSGP